MCQGNHRAISQFVEEVNVVDVTETNKSTSQHDQGTLQALVRKMGTEAQSCPPLSFTTLLRQTPEVGAGCVSSARPDLCGRRRVTSVLPRPNGIALLCFINRER